MTYSPGMRTYPERWSSTRGHCTASPLGPRGFMLNFSGSAARNRHTLFFAEQRPLKLAIVRTPPAQCMESQAPSSSSDRPSDVPRWTRACIPDSGTIGCLHRQSEATAKVSISSFWCILIFTVHGRRLLFSIVDHGEHETPR